MGDGSRTSDSVLATLWQMGDYVTPLVLRLVTDLGVADRLAAGAMSVTDLAEAVDADVDALRRALRLLAARGVFAEQTPDCFALTPLSDLLRTDHPESARGTLSMLPCDLQAWADAGYSIRTGRPAFPQVHGMGRWEYLSTHPSDGRRFHDRMRSASRRIGRLLAEAYPWRGDEHVVDVGGGTGGVLAELLARYPRMTGVLFDQPDVVRITEGVLAGVAERCTVVGGDFFTAVPAGGEVYTLVNVVHDWPEERAERILRSVVSRLTAGSRLLVVEGVPGVADAASRSGALDLHMLVVWGGRERRLEEWRRLLSTVGLELHRMIPAGPRWIIECVP